METIDIGLTRLFVKVVQNGSFSRAAELMRIPKSTVSKGVSRLERETGTKLMVRTTRSLTLTATGRAFYDTCLGPVQTLEDAQKSLQGRDSILTGLVRITAPEDLGSQVIAPAIGELTRKHPLLQFEVHHSDTLIDLVKDGFDLAVRIGKLKSSGLRARRIGEVVLIPVASPQYLKGRTRIKQAHELKDHDCLALNYKTSTHYWILKKDTKSLKVPVVVRISSNQMTSLLNAARAGAGIALVPAFLAQKDLTQGHLIRILPEWSSPGLDVSLVSPQTSASSARLKVTGDQIFYAVQKALGRKS